MVQPPPYHWPFSVNFFNDFQSAQTLLSLASTFFHLKRSEISNSFRVPLELLWVSSVFLLLGHAVADSFFKADALS